MGRSAMKTTIGCCALALALTACGQQHPPADLRPRVHADPSLAARICDPADPTGSVPDGFEPTAVYVCDLDALSGAPVEIGGPPPPSPVIPEPLRGDLGELLSALEVPNDPRWPGACSAIGFAGPEIWLVDDAGLAMHAAYPADGCGQPKNFQRISAALQALSES